MIQGHRTRKHVAAAALVGMAGAIFSPLRAHADAGPDTRAARPNIVFILVDDLRWDAMGCAGHAFARTPHIDRLAAGGVRFANAFVTTSLCSPSRASFLTGMYAHSHGVRTNENQELDPNLPTFATRLRAGGYETAFVGKWHMSATAQPRPGFDYWLGFKGQGVYIDPELNENGRDFKAQGYMTDLLTRYAVDFLKKPHDKPFVLCLWHKAVHSDCIPAERHKNLYAGVRLAEPASFQDTFEGKPNWQRWLAHKRGWGRNKIPPQPAPERVPPVEPWRARNPETIGYYRTLAAVDDSVGAVMGALDEAGSRENTLVIFAGDNGYFQGEHRRMDKRMAYEESIRIPMVAAGPGLDRGRVVEQLVLNIDVAPTLLDAGGLEPSSGMQGRSLRGLAGKAPGWRTSFLYEYWEEAWLPAIPTMIGLRTEEWKYVRYPTLEDLGELYDLRGDPHELRNLVNAPGAADRLRQMRGELERLIRAR